MSGLCPEDWCYVGPLLSRYRVTLTSYVTMNPDHADNERQVWRGLQQLVADNPQAPDGAVSVELIEERVRP